VYACSRPGGFICKFCKRDLTIPICMPIHVQVAMQLHDRNGALSTVCALLGADGPGGFKHVRHWKEPRFAGCCLVQVYAARSDPMS
jgi:hypothetical protein